MIRIAQFLSVAALLSHSVLAAPAVRRQSDVQSVDSYKQDEQYKPVDSYKPDEPYKPAEYQENDKQYQDSNKPPAQHENGYKPPPTYGSGQSNWGKSYEDCVSKCVAEHGSPPKEWAPKEPIPPPQGTGAVHTVMVAPTQGVLRYWPFAVNATVGDTIRYIWTGPGNHTATLSSALSICNRSGQAEQLEWVSGIRNGSASPQTFDVLIKNEDPQFFYCSVAKHCEQGMFGMVQPKMGGNNTVSFHMNKWLDSNPDLKAAWGVVHNQTKDTPADTWGNNISVDGIPESSYMELAKNVVWNRAMFAANPGSQEASSAETRDGSPLKMVGDIATLLSATNQDPNQSGAPSGTPTGSVPAPSAVASELAEVQNQTGAGFKTSAPVWVAAFVGVVSYLVL